MKPESSTVGFFRKFALEVLAARESAPAAAQTQLLDAEWRDLMFDLRLGAAPSPSKYLEAVKDLSASAPARTGDDQRRYVLAGNF